MSRINKFLLGFLISGLLLLGLGSGIAFVEFNNIDYGGEKLIDLNSETITNAEVYSLPKNVGTINIHSSSYSILQSHSPDAITVTADESVSEDQIRFEITQPQALNVYINYDVEEAYEEDIYDDNGNHIGVKTHEGNGNMQIYVHSYLNEQQMLRLMLDDLKDDAYYDYYVAYSVEVKVNPANLNKVNLYDL